MMAGPTCRPGWAAVCLWSLHALSRHALAQHFVGNFDFPQEGTHFTFKTVDSVNLTWNSHFHHGDASTGNVTLVLFDSSSAVPFVNQSVFSDGFEILSMNFNGQTVTNGNFSIEDSGSTGDSYSSGSFDVVVDNSASPTTWSLGSIPTATVTAGPVQAAATTGSNDGDSHDHGGFLDSSNSTPSAPSGISPTIIALIVILSVAFLFVGLLLFRFIRVRRRMRLSLPLRKDSGGSFGSSTPPTSYVSPESCTHSVAWPSPQPPQQLSKQQRILGMNVGENPQRTHSRRWFGHALRNSDCDDPATKYGIGKGMPSPGSIMGPGHVPQHSHALRPAGTPASPANDTVSKSTAMCSLSEHDESLSELSTDDSPSELQTEDSPKELQTGDSPKEIQDGSARELQEKTPRKASAARYPLASPVELPAKELNRSTLASSVRSSEQTLAPQAFVAPQPMGDLSFIGRQSGRQSSTDGLGARGSGKALRVMTGGPPPMPLDIPELPEGKSPRKSPGFRATAMSAIRGSGMTVPFALASPRNWKKTAKASQGEGVPF